MSVNNKWILETERLQLRELTPGDAGFMVRLMNSPGYLRFIANRNIHGEPEALAYLQAGPLHSYAVNGFGLWMMELVNGEPIGICGLVKRENFAEVDLGFALLPGYEQQGYAREAAAGCIQYARVTAGLPRLIAVTTRDNISSIALLLKLNFQFEGLVPWPATNDELNLYGLAL